MTLWNAAAVTLAVLCASLVFGCVAKAPVETEWVAAREGAEDLEAARAACKARAVEETKTLEPEGLGARAAGGIFITCMREKGWELREKLDVKK